MKVMSVVRPWMSPNGVRFAHFSPLKETVKQVKKFRGKPTLRDYAILGAIGSFFVWEAFHANLSKRGWQYTGSGFIGEMFWRAFGKYSYRKPIEDQIKESKKDDYNNRRDFFWRILCD